MFVFGWGRQVYIGCLVLIWLGIGKVVGHVHFRSHSGTVGSWGCCLSYQHLSKYSFWYFCWLAVFG